jgi:ubiquinone/menaquinone biosynthesis C-methylase UbiE
VHNETNIEPTVHQASQSSAIKARRNDFDLVAPIYDALASFVFAGAIRRAQLSLLPRLSDARSALIIGGGTGWFLLELLQNLGVQHVLYVEKSPKMIRYSQDLIRKHAPALFGRVEFRLGTEESLTASDGPFDLVVTNFFLDLFSDENSAEVAEVLHKYLADTGRWLFVDFQEPPGVLANSAARALFKVMFTFFNVVARMESRRPPNYERIFGRLGMNVLEERHFYASFISAQLLTKTPR